MRSTFTIAVLFCAFLAGCTTTYTFTPQPGAGQEQRFDKGAPTTFSNLEQGSVQVTPLGVNDENGRLILGVAVFNKSARASNFGIENLSLAKAERVPVKLYSANELIAQAKREAAWQAVAVALSGASAAYAASANAYSTTNGYVSTPSGMSTFHSTTYNPALAYAATAAATAATGYGLYQIRQSLDSSLVNIRGHVLQTTTVDPGASYGGEAIAHSLGRYPQDIVLDVEFNGETHTFKYIVSRSR